MIGKEKLKEIILSNKEFILNQVEAIIKREGFRLPEAVEKVIVLYGVRRSGKTFILYDLFRNFREESLYIDFEDERLADFRLEDFETLREAFLELNPRLVDKNKVFLFDEIQNIAGWEKFCRRVAEREKTRVYVSGSSSKIMPEEIHTSLRSLRATKWRSNPVFEIASVASLLRNYNIGNNISKAMLGALYCPIWTRMNLYA